ncbi:MAG: methyltransferase domain-containing protein [Candidatus Eiseniibacteriota bacterium]
MSAAWCERPVRASGEPALFIAELIGALPPGSRVLDAGCGPGSWNYATRPDLRITAFDIKFPPGPPAAAANVSVARADLARLPYRDHSFDLTVCHYVLEHVTELEACCNSLARVTSDGGTLYLSVPRAAAFDDRLYRFAGYFAKYALGKFRKRIEHQQRFDLERLLELFRRRGFHAVALARVPAGFSWMNDARTKRLQGPFTDALAWLHRTTGVDLAAQANFVLAFRKGAAMQRPEPPPIERRVTHVCRECGELSVCAPPAPAPALWTCPWCGQPNPFGRAR